MRYTKLTCARVTLNRRSIQLTLNFCIPYSNPALIYFVERLPSTPSLKAIPHMLNPTIFQVPYKRPYEILATLLKKNQRSLGAILLSCYLNIINQFTTLLQITDKTMSLLTQLQRRSQSQQLYVRITVSDQKIKNL